ncbi:MAG TPA: hypothetical protein VF807_03970 [Ktedonobacterales bacterium]
MATKKTATHHKSATEGVHDFAKTTYKADRALRQMEVLSSGNPKRIEKYFLRRWAYKMFGRFMGKTINRI